MTRAFGCLACLLFVTLSVRADGAADARELAEKIDREVAERLTQEKIQPATQAEDAEFLRRVYLDIVGRIPSVAEARTFLADPAADKRTKLVDTLLDSPGYVAHATTVWQALLLPENSTANYQLRMFLPGFEAWLRKQFTDNVPYDRMVRDLITAPVTDDPRVAYERYRSGLAPEPTALAFYVAKEACPEEVAAAVARLFLGLRLDCAQCHDHPTDKWKRQQFWEFTAFFAGLQKKGDGYLRPLCELSDRREIAIPNTSQVVQAAFLDGSEPQWRYKVGPRVTLAEWITTPENPYFARAAVNRTWAQFFGAGIVDPVDEMTCENSKPSHPELLDELGKQFASHAFDQKFLVRAIVLSKTYQRTSARTSAGQEEPRLLARMSVKGLSGEQMFDSLSLAIGVREARATQDPFVFGQTSPRSEFLARFATQEKRTKSQTTILQALSLMNGKFVADGTNPKRGPTLAAVADAPFLDTAGKVEALYLSALSRKPRPAELDRFVKYVDEGGTRKDRKAAAQEMSSGRCSIAVNFCSTIEDFPESHATFAPGIDSHRRGIHEDDRLAVGARPGVHGLRVGTGQARAKVPHPADRARQGRTNDPGPRYT